jgi:TetR/AcrR family transcriptional regulator, transcriptional repressor for nem operon
MRNPEATRETILKEAGILFNTLGYKATSISNITDATGFTKGAIYRHFSSKEVLEKETLQYLSSLVFEKMRGLIKEQPTAGAKLRAVVRFFETYVNSPIVQGGCPILNVAIEADDSNPALREEAAKTLQMIHASLVYILMKGIENGQLKPAIDTEFYATLFIASLEGGIMMSKVRNSNDDMKKVIQHLEHLISDMET